MLPCMRREAVRRLAQGRAEVGMARTLLASGGSSGAAFHSHQAAEMLLDYDRERAQDLCGLAERVERWVSAASA
jgi:HEPN domain-containing protein